MSVPCHYADLRDLHELAKVPMSTQGYYDVVVRLFPLAKGKPTPCELYTLLLQLARGNRDLVGETDVLVGEEAYSLIGYAKLLCLSPTEQLKELPTIQKAERLLEPEKLLKMFNGIIEPTITVPPTFILAMQPLQREIQTKLVELAKARIQEGINAYSQPSKI